MCFCYQIPGRELVASAIGHVDDVETTRVLFLGGDDTDETLVGTAGDGGDITDIEFDDTGDLTGGDIEADGVVGLDERVRVTDSAAVMGDDVRDGTGLTCYSLSC